MASLTIRNVDDDIKSLLRQQAARHGCSMEQEARDILRQAVSVHPAGAGFAEDFAGCSLPFDDGCAAEYALLFASRIRQGQAISTEDAQIAAIALTHALPLATRDGKDFKGIKGLTVVNPWA